MEQLLTKAFFICLIILCQNINAQVKIGDNPGTINSSSLLELESTDKGVLIPRLTSSQKIAIASPTTGLLVFQTDSVAGFYYYNGTHWEILLSDTTKIYTNNRCLDVIGKGVGTTKTTTTSVDNAIVEQFDIDDQLFFDISHPSDYIGGDITIHLDFIPMGSESGKNVRWEMTYQVMINNSVVSGTTGSLDSGDLPLSSTQYMHQDVNFIIPESELTGATAIHFIIQRAATTNGTDPSSHPSVIHCTARYNSFR